MSAPIDPQLAAFITQAVREAFDETQRRQRKYYSNTNDNEPYNSRPISGGFGSRTNLRQPTGFGGFGSQSSQPSHSSGLPSGLGGFGSRTNLHQPSQPTGFGGFGSQPSQPSHPSGLGGFGSQPTGLGGFGSQPSQPSYPSGLGGFGSQPSQPTGFGAMPSLQPQTNFSKAGVRPTWDEITKGGNTQTPCADTTSTTKKVVINDGQTKTSDVFHPSATSMYAFAKPTTSTTTTTTTTSNAVVDSGFGLCIPNQNKQNQFVFISDKSINNQSVLDNVVASQTILNKNLKPATTNHVSNPLVCPQFASSGGFGTCPQSASSGGFGAPRKQPPNYPPPVYSNPPELILDSTSESEGEDEKKQKTNSSEKKKGLMEEFDAQVPDAITNILSDLLGVNMTEELTSLANELSGISEGATNKPSTTTNSQETSHFEPTATTSAREFREAYKALKKYLSNDEICLDTNVIYIILNYLQNMLFERLFDANILPRPKFGCPKKVNHEVHTKVVKAICVELSVSNRFAALEDMIKNMQFSELMNFKQNMDL